MLGLGAHFGPHVIALIDAATDRAESYTGRALINRTLVATFDRFDCRKIELPYPPLVEVNAVRYLDDDGEQQTLDSAEYRVLTSDHPGSIEVEYGESWPTPRPVSDAVEIEYVAGYGDEPANVPMAIRLAITMMVGEWIEFREGIVLTSVSEMPNGAKSLLNSHRLGRLFVGQGM